LAECLQNSSNVGTAKFVLQHYKSDPEDFTDHAIQLGLHMKPNFDIPSSNFPTIKTPESSDWSAISLPSMSIGYYARISPLQLLMLYNTIANKGVMMQPYMVSEIHAQGKKAQKIEPKVLNKQAISIQTTQVLTDMLTTVIDKGTASNIKSENYKIAGKTGTAWLSSGNKGYGDKKEFQAAFAGFFPANDPQFTIIVVVNSPNGVKYSGSQISAPIFKAISDRIYATHIKTQPVIAQYSVPEAPGVLKGDFYQTRMIFNELGISSQLLQADSITETPKFIEPSREAHSVKLKPVAYNSSLVPDVRGMGLRDAMKVLKSMGYQVTFNGYGRVTDQSPSSGSARKNSGNSIHLILKPF
jgi:cell division protein FtsI (penicillin-binding protein 3)